MPCGTVMFCGKPHSDVMCSAHVPKAHITHEVRITF